ncbi:MAG: ribosome recycling factor [bacterium]
MPIEEIIKSGDAKMQKTIAETKREFLSIRTGRANPVVLDRLSIDYYGSATPIRQAANVSVQDGTTLFIQPYDKTIIKDIEKAILKSDLGVTPNNDGANIRITFPPLTEDRRKELVKQVKKIGEENKVAVRNIRREMSDALKKAEKDENLPEDEVKKEQDRIQKITDKYTKEIDTIVMDKEKEVMSV